jgi:hypothetical protein
MVWTWAKYADRYTTGVTKNPSLFAFGSMFFAFEAGTRLKGLKQSADVLAYSSFLGFLLVALLLSYFLARAIRQLRNSDDQSPQSRG